MCRQCAVSSALVEQADRSLAFARQQVHVPHRRREVLVAREVLNRLRWRAPHREVRAEHMAEDLHVACGGEPRSVLRAFDPVV